MLLTGVIAICSELVNQCTVTIKYSTVWIKRIRFPLLSRPNAPRGGKGAEWWKRERRCERSDFNPCEPDEIVINSR